MIALIGDLGAGKTTLTQSLARGLGITATVNSPTFALIQEYSGRVPLFHFDPYRLETPELLFDLGFDEYFERGGVVVVEWADKIAALLPEERLTLRLEIETDGEEPGDDVPRLLTAEASGTRYTALLAELVALPELQALQVSGGRDV